MADSLLNSFKLLAAEKRGLEARERHVKRLELQFVGNLGRLLSKAGYRLVSTNGDTSKSTARANSGSIIKRIRCPECDRRFGRPLHLARHMSAIHKKKASGKRARKA